MFLALEDRELLVLVAALFALVAVYRVRQQLGPCRNLALAAMLALVVALTTTNLEEVVPEPAAGAINLVEHVAYLAHTSLLLLWVTRGRLRSALR